ncbi:VOC family protein [Cryobacterium cheniae]|uniref:Bleomycin resistance protein n=2 Tax=Cryobacterium cheniae TaxID=1259262 RepID=A0A4R8XI50_9MICO|nr:VOC family protein [Cryobacterium cheniae]
MAFWCGLCGFEIRYDRPEDGFAYIALGGSHVMLEQEVAGENWIAGSLESPYGRGINFQIEVPDIDVVLSSLTAAGITLFREPRTTSYRVGAGDVDVREFITFDPDGYLLRFQSLAKHQTAQ